MFKDECVFFWRYRKVPIFIIHLSEFIRLVSRLLVVFVDELEVEENIVLLVSSLFDSKPLVHALLVNKATLKLDDMIVMLCKDESSLRTKTLSLGYNALAGDGFDWDITLERDGKFKEEPKSRVRYYKDKECHCYGKKRHSSARQAIETW